MRSWPGAGRQAGKTTRDGGGRVLLMAEVLQVPADPEIRRGLDEAARGGTAVRS